MTRIVFLPDGYRWTVDDGNLSLTSNSSKLKQTLGIDRSAAIANKEQEYMTLYGGLPWTVTALVTEPKPNAARVSRNWRSTSRDNGGVTPTSIRGARKRLQKKGCQARCRHISHFLMRIIVAGPSCCRRRTLHLQRHSQHRCNTEHHCRHSLLQPFHH